MQMPSKNRVTGVDLREPDTQRDPADPVAQIMAALRAKGAAIQKRNPQGSLFGFAINDRTIQEDWATFGQDEVRRFHVMVPAHLTEEQRQPFLTWARVSANIVDRQVLDQRDDWQRPVEVETPGAQSGHVFHSLINRCWVGSIPVVEIICGLVETTPA